MGVVEQYRRDSFREIRPCNEMDIIRKAMARADENKRLKKRAVRESIVLLAAIVLLVCSAVWILR